MNEIHSVLQVQGAYPHGQTASQKPLLCMCACMCVCVFCENRSIHQNHDRYYFTITTFYHINIHEKVLVRGVTRHAVWLWQKKVVKQHGHLYTQRKHTNWIIGKFSKNSRYGNKEKYIQWSCRELNTDNFRVNAIRCFLLYMNWFIWNHRTNI